MHIKRLAPGDESILQSLTPCFDHPVKHDAAIRFLQSDNHHIFAAMDDNGDPVGFVSGVETTHPDKGTEMFLYELAVHEEHREKGYGTELVQALAGLARQRGCYGMWVLTEPHNAAALATYHAAGGHRESQPVMLSWQFDQTV
jgi:ribosomal protein S18 acetylase RimI-like enzyme